MAVAEGIGGISISFTSGVALAAVCGLGGRWTCASFLLMAVCAFAAVLRTRDNWPPGLYLLLFFSLGAFTYASGSLLPCPGVSLFSRQMDSFCTLIDSLAFKDSDTGPLVKALLTGRRESLSGALVQSFRDSGASHILALSGLHLGVIYGILAKTLGVLGNSPLSRKIRAACCVSFCTFYTVMTGAGPSIVRALLFICINEASHLMPHRRKSASGVYCGALLIQLVLNPRVITSVGFQLSYLAMCGIFFIFPRLRSLYPDSGRTVLDRWFPAKWLWNGAALSISCQLLTAPLVWIRFHSFPQYFLLTNLIALPLSEGLIIGAVACTLLQAAGICPQQLCGITAALARNLIFCLETISAM